MKQLFILGTLLLALPLLAETDNMQFLGYGPNTYNGFHAYPYYISVNGGQTLPAMQISFEDVHSLFAGETWKAIEPFPVPATVEWLFLQDIADGGSDPGINAAAWYIMDGKTGPTLNADALGWYNAALSQHFHQHEFDGIESFFAIEGTQSGGAPEAPDFLVKTSTNTTPEPASLFLTGTGLVVAWFTNRQARKALAALKK